MWMSAGVCKIFAKTINQAILEQARHNVFIPVDIVSIMISYTFDTFEEQIIKLLEVYKLYPVEQSFQVYRIPGGLLSITLSCGRDTSFCEFQVEFWEAEEGTEKKNKEVEWFDEDKEPPVEWFDDGPLIYGPLHSFWSQPEAIPIRQAMNKINLAIFEKNVDGAARVGSDLSLHSIPQLLETLRPRGSFSFLYRFIDIWNQYAPANSYIQVGGNKYGTSLNFCVQRPPFPPVAKHKNYREAMRDCVKKHGEAVREYNELNWSGINGLQFRTLIAHLSLVFPDAFFGSWLPREMAPLPPPCFARNL